MKCKLINLGACDSQVKTTMNGSTYTANFISVGRGIVLGSMTEDREVASKAKREPTAEWPKKALSPRVSVAESESSSDSSMERLLQEVRAFVLRSDPGAAEAATSTAAPTSAAGPPTAQ